jgi:hypothetical protein
MKLPTAYCSLLTAILLCTAAAVAISADFSGRLRVDPQWNYTRETGTATARAFFSALLDWSHTDGTNANAMTSLAVHALTFTSGQTNRLSLATDLRDPFGDVVAINRVRFFAVSSTLALRVGGGTGAWTNWISAADASITLRPGGLALFVAPDLTGYAIGTATNLYFTNLSTNTGTSTVFIGGSL